MKRGTDYRIVRLKDGSRQFVCNGIRSERFAKVSEPFFKEKDRLPSHLCQNEKGVGVLRTSDLAFLILKGAIDVNLFGNGYVAVTYKRGFNTVVRLMKLSEYPKTVYMIEAREIAWLMKSLFAIRTDAGWRLYDAESHSYVPLHCEVHEHYAMIERIGKSNVIYAQLGNRWFIYKMKGFGKVCRSVTKPEIVGDKIMLTALEGDDENVMTLDFDGNEVKTEEAV